MRWTEGRALLVCRAPFTPFGAARRAQEVADSEPWIDAGVANQNRYIEEKPDLGKYRSSVLQNHPMMMTRDDYVGSGWSGWRLSDVFGFPTISRRKERPDNLSPGHKSDMVLARQALVNKTTAVVGVSWRAAHVALLLADAAGHHGPQAVDPDLGTRRITERFRLANPLKTRR